MGILSVAWKVILWVWKILMMPLKISIEVSVGADTIRDFIRAVMNYLGAFIGAGISIVLTSSLGALWELLYMVLFIGIAFGVMALATRGGLIKYVALISFDWALGVWAVILFEYNVNFEFYNVFLMSATVVYFILAVLVVSLE